MAKKLTVPIRVNEINIEKIKELLEHDKINYILRESEEGLEKIRYNMKYATYTQGTRIQYGDIVIRDGQQIDGGLVLNLMPGDKLIRDGIEVKDIQFQVRKAFNIQIGDIAEKILEDGQSVVVNRQPTLHKTGMIAFKALVRPGKTLRINLGITGTFNADEIYVSNRETE